MENFNTIQSLIFVFNKELNLSDEEVFKLPWHSVVKKYKLLKEYWNEQEKKYKEMEQKAKSKKR